jgi:hypothetical protein
MGELLFWGVWMREKVNLTGAVTKLSVRALELTMEDGINQLFHPAYPLTTQHQPFQDSHDIVQDQFHRMPSHPFASSSLTVPPNSHSSLQLL